MHRLQDEVRQIVAREGIFCRADHPGLSGTAERLVRRGELVAVLPGVCSTPERAAQREVRVLALARHEPDAVLVERTAAQVSFWPALPGDVVTCVVPGPRPSRRGFRFLRRAIPPELVGERGHLRFTVLALTALDLCDELGGDALDHALRTRSSSLEDLHRALELTRHRRGNGDRRALLLDSRDEPWSAAERLAHRLLRTAGVTGWQANLAVVTGGRLFYVDIAFPGIRLAVEIDGRLHEDDPDVFENDRRRQNALVLDGWAVLRFTWTMLRDHPDQVVQDILAAVRMRKRRVPYARGLDTPASWLPEP